MKILHVSDSMTGGGAEEVFKDTLKASEENNNINSIYVSDEKRNVLSYIFSLRHFLLILEKLKSEKPDIIHLQNYYHFLSPSILLAIRFYKRSRKPQLKVIFTAHDYHIVFPNSSLRYFNKSRPRLAENKSDLKFYRKYDERGISHSLMKYLQHRLNYKILGSVDAIDKIVSPSFYLKGVFETHHIRNPIEVIRNPILDRFCAGDEPPPPSEQTDIFRLVYFGRIEKEKGLVEFVSQLNTLKFAFKISLTLIGEDGSDAANDLKEMQFGKTKLIFKGRLERDKLAPMLKTFDAFVLPSVLPENAPLSILEAAMCGLSILTRNHGGMAEMAAETQIFEYFDPNDISSIESAITSLYLMRKHGLRNHCSNPENFTFSCYKQSMQKLYSSCLK